MAGANVLLEMKQEEGETSKWRKEKTPKRVLSAGTCGKLPPGGRSATEPSACGDARDSRAEVASGGCLLKTTRRA